MILKGLTRLVVIATLLILTQGIAYAAAPISDGFDYPVGIPQRFGGTGYVTETRGDGDGWFNAQDYGVRNPNYGNLPHLGEDWNQDNSDTGGSNGNSDCGNPVYSIANGEIIYAQNGGTGWGNVVIIRHKLIDGTQVESMYGHLNTINANGIVARGEEIGTIGDGDLDGCNPENNFVDPHTEFWAHLHFEIRYSNSRNWGSPGPGYSSDGTGWTDPSDFIDSNRPHIIPLVGDWNGNNIDDTGTFDSRASRYSLDSGVTLQMGEPGDFPIIGDWNGNGVDTIGIYRPKTAEFHLDFNNDQTTDQVINFGEIGDFPIIGDWNNDGTDEIGVFRSLDSNTLRTTFFLKYPDRVEAERIEFGTQTDFPITGDWNNDGIDDIGVFRRNDPDTSNAVFYLKVGDQTLDFPYGNNDDIPITGKPYNDELTRIGVYRPSAQNPFIFKAEPIIDNGNPQLSISISENPDPVISGQNSQVTVHVTSVGAPVTGASIEVSTTGGILGQTIGTTNANGDFITTYAAPIATSQIQHSISATATKDGYNSASGSDTITVQPNTPIPPDTQTEIFVGQGFDKCEIPTLSQMQNWITNSPYRAVNLYIGGSTRSCDNPTLTASYVSQLGQQGWKFIPTWAGPQAAGISNDPITAYNQGISEANAATDVAKNLGLALTDGSGTVIYYDLESYDTTNTLKRDAIKSFMSGWTARLHEIGSKAGVYGSSSGSAISDFASISNVPDAIWAAHWLDPYQYRSDASVWDVAYLSNGLWNSHQRIRQYAGPHAETWGGVTMTIDSDAIDGIVASIITSPTAEIIDQSISPTIATLGDELTFVFNINNPNPDDIENIRLGAQIRTHDPQGTWEDDPDNDIVVNLLPGSHNEERTFIIPPTAGSGFYDARWVLVDDTNENWIDSAIMTRIFEVRMDGRTGGPDHFGYTFKDSNSIGGPNYEWIDISQTGQSIIPDCDDCYLNNIPVGFFFNYYGTDYSQLSITNNGLTLASGGTYEYTNQPIGNSGPHNFIAPFWDDIVTWDRLNADAIYYQTIGEAPNRKFVVQWNDNYHYSSSPSGITFEAILYEGTNNIKFQYQDVNFGVTGWDNGASATVGIESANGQGLQYSYNERVINPDLAILFKYPQFAGTNMYLSKQAPASKDHGSTMTYTLYYHNFGDTQAENVVLKDTLPQEVEYILASDGGTYDSNTRKVTWNIGTVAPLGHNYRTVNVRISDNVAVGTVIQNNARIDTSTLEVRYDDNDANAQTRVTGSTLPPDVSVEPNNGGTGAPSVVWHRPITFSYNNPTAIGVDINIQFNDGSTESGIMTGGAPEWTYTTTFSRAGNAIVTYSIQRGSASYSTDYDVRNSDGDFITANDIETYIENNYPTSPMLDEANIGSSFIDAGNANGIDPAFLVATAELEGRFGTQGWALSHPEAHNTFGWGVPSGSTPVNSINSADSWGDMVDRVAERIVNGPYYFNAGLYTVEQIRSVYAGDPNPQSIVNMMNQLYAFSQNVPSTVSFNIYIDPAGYIYDVVTGDRIAGATVWLQWSDGEGGWVNVPTNYLPNAIMQPDTNPLITGVDGMYQWDVLPGSYRVHVEATDYYPVDSIVVSIPPAVTDLHVGLTRIPSESNQPPVAADDTVTTDEDTPVTFNVATNDNDADGNLNPSSAITLTDPSHCTVVNDGDGMFTYIPDAEYNGADSFTYEICDTDGLCDTATVAITVNPVNDPPVASVDLAEQTVQYSDGISPVTISASDIDSPLTLTTSWKMNDGAEQTGLPDDLTLSSDSCTTSDPSTPCTWTLEGNANTIAGNYNITFNVSDGQYGVLKYTNLIVSPEDSMIAFDDGNPVAVKVAESGGDSETFSLMVNIKETIPDISDALAPFSGDINLAEVSVSLVPVGPGPSVTASCSRTVAGTGYDATLTLDCEFDNVGVNTYEVMVSVNGGYYIGSGENVLVVYDPSLGFTTGGGTFLWPGTDEKTNFGYTMKYNKKGAKVQGSLLLVRHLPDGTIYRVKSNALYGLSIGEADTYGWASFSGKATYLEPGWLEPVGNHEFIVYVEDHNEPENGADSFWIKVKGQDGKPIAATSLNDPPVDNKISLSGGNIVVPHK